MTRVVYLYRLAVVLPEGSEDSDWEPENWEDACVERGWVDPDHATSVELPPFSWPRRRLYMSRTAAEERAKMLRSYGATVTVERSNPVTWPNAESISVGQMPEPERIIVQVPDSRRA